jgi:hypothetical protein
VNRGGEDAPRVVYDSHINRTGPMTTFTLTKQITEQCSKEIRFTVYSADTENHRAVEIVEFQTGANTGGMIQNSRAARHFIGNSRNLYRSLLNQGWVAA